MSREQRLTSNIAPQELITLFVLYFILTFFSLGGGAHTEGPIQRSDDNLLEFGSFLLPCGTTDQMEVIRIGGR